MTTYAERFEELTAQIEHLLSLPLPIPAERHLLREAIFALKYEQLGLTGDLSEPEQDQLARDFTLSKVPQRVASYPMHLRETVMPAQAQNSLTGDRPRLRRQAGREEDL